MNRAELLAILIDLRALPPEQRRKVWMALPDPAQRAILEEWWWQAHGGQAEPDCGPNGDPWRVWAIVAGRGFGKTRAGAEWVWARARENEAARIALVAATLDEVERVMIRGESGLLALARCDERPRWIASRRVLEFPTGAEGHAFSAEVPDKLRGPQHHHAWCDELAKWPNADATWDNLMLGLRLGERPRTIVTTTPKPAALLKRILALDFTARTEGRTADNPHLPADFRDAVTAMYGGTRLGRQELEGELLEDHERALWSRTLIDKARGILPGAGRWLGEAETEGAPGLALTEGPLHHDASRRGPPPRSGEDFRRVVIGLDPPASTGGDSCGIVVCGRDADGVAWVLADLSAGGLSPEAWARRVAEAAAQYGAGRVVAEKNQGGDMIASVLRAVDADLPVRLVAATKSKAARAEPIALRFETGRARLAGRFPELEDQLCALTWNGYQAAGSPDRADAMVWAMTELFDKERGRPSVRAL
ncbi:terminase family protein [Sphingosinicella sp. YJ22]|uniref:DNA-packaging protein n=1 Tax=Sphingosinicella sp. YJ22 TaxID=1104780 RepID=UPI00140A5219|nr:terminase family protein [Sphingosinicella sp. YJ22]